MYILRKVYIVRDYTRFMQRKLIAHGPSSLTVALPHLWIKRHALKKGDSIAIEEEERGLRILPTPSRHKRTIAVDVSNHKWPSIATVLTTVYRRGYDQVRVHYSSSREYQYISRAVQSLLGLAIMENGSKSCLIKSLPTELEQDFPTLFRRVFLILLQQLEDLGDNLEKPEEIKEFYHRDADLNAVVNLAIRMINQGYLQERFEELHFFHALLILEECGDDLVRFTAEAKQPVRNKQGVEHCHAMLRMLYDAYFQKKKGVQDFYKQYYVYWADMKQPKTPVYDYFIAAKGQTFYLRSIVEKVVQLAELLLLPQARKELQV